MKKEIKSLYLANILLLTDFQIVKIFLHESVENVFLFQML